MLNNRVKKEIKTKWQYYLKNGKRVLDAKGNEIEEIDKKRLKAIEDIKGIISSYNDVYSFKTALDGYNKRNNLWGFTAIKGQMFFNLLVRHYEENLNELDQILPNLIAEPKSLDDALNKIENLEKELIPAFLNAPDKRKVANPSSVGYFLSYFWQIYNPLEWPILYSSLINAFKELDIWEEKDNQKETYKYFFNLNDEIKNYLEKETHSKPTNWDIEHCLWDIHLDIINQNEETRTVKVQLKETEEDVLKRASFDISEYIIPKVANLVELGEDESKSASKKGSLYEQKVTDIFKHLGFEVQPYGQGTGPNPDCIVKLSSERTAFMVDAKAYKDGYIMNTADKRAMKEYINHFSPILENDRYSKIGFIVVSNSFKSDLAEFRSEVTWEMPIKRFILLTSNALLHLLAYKEKDHLTTSEIVKKIIDLGELITEDEIISSFDDV